MIIYLKGDLLDCDAEVLVNAVNTVGVMGKGIALRFKERFPDNLKAYQLACRDHKVKVGKVFNTMTGYDHNPKCIVNFPTKEHWRDPSQLQWIVDGVSDLIEFVVRNNIKSIAIPALGCGLGGLKWDQVKQVIEDRFDGIEGVTVLLYEPND